MNPTTEETPGAAIQTQMPAVGRYGRAEEVAAALASLASPDAAFVTGGPLNVDGGIFV